MVSRLERGRLDEVSLVDARRIASVLDIRLDIVARWRGGEIDRMVNARHAALHEAAALRLGALPGWQVSPEVSFNVYGERGIIDLVGWHPGRRALLVIELKSEIVDVQALIGAVDRYRRLAGRAVFDRGWRPKHVSAWVFLAKSRSNHRALASHAAVLRSAFPTDGRGLSGWLVDPLVRVDGLSFLPYAHGTNVRHSIRTPQRVQPRVRSRAPARDVPPGATRNPSERWRHGL